MVTSYKFIKLAFGVNVNLKLSNSFLSFWEPKNIKCLKTFKILAVPGQRLDWPFDKIKFLKISVVLHFAMKNRKLACKMSRVSVPKNSGSIANRVFKKLLVKTRDDYVISFSEVVRNARFICQQQMWHF